MEKDVIIDTIDSVDTETQTPAEGQKPKGKRGRPPKVSKQKNTQKPADEVAEKPVEVPNSDEKHEEPLETAEPVANNEAPEAVETATEEVAAIAGSPECADEIHDMTLKADTILSINAKKEEEMASNIAKVDEFINWAKASGMNTDQITAGTTEEYKKYIAEKEKAIKRTEIANRIKALLEELKAV